MSDTTPTTGPSKSETLFETAAPILPWPGVPTTGPSKSETLFGGTSAAATFNDGTAKTVTVRQLAIKDYNALLAASDDEAQAVGLYTGLSPEEVARLTLDSHDALVTEGERLNADFFGRWVRRRMARFEALAPGAVEKALSASASRTS